MARSWSTRDQLVRTAARPVQYGAHMKLRHWVNAAAGLAAIAAAAGAVTMPGDSPAWSRPHPTVTKQVLAPTVPRCSTPAPKTAAGFQALFATVNVAEFGAADVGLSVPMPDGRSVWLWGDTMSWTKFVHSSAIVQDRGCLHVSRAGAQLLPNDGDRFYWIEAARVTSGTELEVTAEEIVQSGTGTWGFKSTGFNRVARVTVDQVGDLTFAGWTKRYAAQPAAQLADLVRLPNGQLSYSPRLHPEFKLASGAVLKTTARNWDDGLQHPIETYRVVFQEAGR